MAAPERSSTTSTLLRVPSWHTLVQMPAPLRVGPMIHSPPSDLASEHRPKRIPPVPHRFVTNIDATFGQNVFNLAQRQRIADVQHHREANDLGRAVEITAGISRLRLRNSPSPLKPIYSDNAFAAVHASSYNPFNHQHPLNCRAIFKQDRAATTGRVASTCSLRNLDCWLYWSDPVSLTMPCGVLIHSEWAFK